MARVILVTGGARSGKSEYAQRLGESLSGPRCYVATAVPFDDEMRRRIRRHQQARDRADWRTVEAPLDPAAAIRRQSAIGVFVVDCLTVWVSNLMHSADETGATLDERVLAGRVGELRSACEAAPGTVILVTNEVGLGIVPDNPVARRYRDLLGRCNQIVAAAADTVTLMTCGLPLHLKGGAPT